MRVNRPSIRLMATLAIFTAILFVTSTWAAAEEKVLHSFSGGADGTYPYGGLIFDAAGNLYGTTTARGGGNLDGEGAGELRQRHGREDSLRRPDLRCRRQSLRHDVPRRRLRLRDGVRVDARSGRNLDGEGAVRSEERR